MPCNSVATVNATLSTASLNKMITPEGLLIALKFALTQRLGQLNVQGNVTNGGGIVITTRDYRINVYGTSMNISTKIVNPMTQRKLNEFKVKLNTELKLIQGTATQIAIANALIAKKGRVTKAEVLLTGVGVLEVEMP